MAQHRSGPVRSAEAREAVLRATALLLERAGYDHLTIEGIAAEAGVGKQTIYRWWPTRSAIIADCLLEGLITPTSLVLARSGDVEADLAAWLGGIFGLIEGRGGDVLLRSLIAAAAEDEAVGRRLHDALAADSSLIERLADAVADGQIDREAPLEQIGEALIGAVILRALGRKPTDQAIVRQLLLVSLGAFLTDSARRG